LLSSFPSYDRTSAVQTVELAIEHRKF